MLYIKIQKSIFLDFLIRNGLSISLQTINKIYEYIQETNQSISLDSFHDFKTKIKSTLVSLKLSLEKVKKKKNKTRYRQFLYKMF